MPTPTKTEAVATIPQRSAALVTFQQLLVARRSDYKALLGGEADPDEFIANAIAYAIKTPILLDESKVDRGSLMLALMDTARLKLMPHGIVPGCHMVPFWNTRKNKLDVVAVTDYRAEIDLATRSGSIAKVNVQAVYTEDDFEMKIVQGDPVILHEWDWDAGVENRGTLRGVYAVTKLANGEVLTTWLNLAQLVAIRDSVGKRNRGKAGVWDDGDEGFLAMSFKSVIRRNNKLLPRSGKRQAALAQAIAIEERAERDEPHPFSDAGMLATLEPTAPLPSGNKDKVLAATAKPSVRDLGDPAFTPPDRTPRPLHPKPDAPEAVNALPGPIVIENEEQAAADDYNAVLEEAYHEGSQAHAGTPCPHTAGSDVEAAWTAGYQSTAAQPKPQQAPPSGQLPF